MKQLCKATKKMTLFLTAKSLVKSAMKLKVEPRNVPNYLIPSLQ